MMRLKFCAGVQVVYMRQEQAEKVDKLSRDYGKMLGY